MITVQQSLITVTNIVVMVNDCWLAAILSNNFKIKLLTINNNENYNYKLQQQQQQIDK